MLRCIAIDDEPIALKVIEIHAHKVPFVTLCATFQSATEALTYLKNNSIDLVFLDINMPDISGLDFAQLINDSTAVIFTTAYAQYALDAFNLNAIDYLAKPIAFNRFLQGCQKAYEGLKHEEPLQPYLFVKDGYDLVRVVLDELLYVESDGNYLTFKEKNKKTLARMTMTEAVETLPKRKFCRVHKSYIVALDHIEKIERHQLTTAGLKIPLADTYKDELLARLAP